MPNTFKILGSGAGPGAPSFFCDCKGCREALAAPTYSRTRSSAFIATENSRILVDTSPDLRAQLIRERIADIDQIFLTHWHYDHFGGLGELEYYVKLHRRQPIPLYVPPSAVRQFESAFPELHDVFIVTPWEFGQTYPLDDLRLTPLPARHSVETAGFLLQSGQKSLAYFPDTAGLPPETADRVTGVDWLICDATFHGDNWFPRSHMSVQEAIELGRAVQARSTILTHLSVHYSQAVTAGDLNDIIAPHPGVLAAYDGMMVSL